MVFQSCVSLETRSWQTISRCVPPAGVPKQSGNRCAHPSQGTETSSSILGRSKDRRRLDSHRWSLNKMQATLFWNTLPAQQVLRLEARAVAAALDLGNLVVLGQKIWRCHVSLQTRPPSYRLPAATTRRRDRGHLFLTTVQKPFVSVYLRAKDKQHVRYPRKKGGWYYQEIAVRRGLAYCMTLTCRLYRALIVDASTKPKREVRVQVCMLFPTVHLHIMCGARSQNHQNSARVAYAVHCLIWSPNVACPLQTVQADA